MYNTLGRLLHVATECTAWTLDRFAFWPPQKKSISLQRIRKKCNSTRTGTSWGHAPLTDHGGAITKLAGAMDEEHQLDGTDIIREGDEGKTFYVISSGTVEVTIKDIGKVAELHEGDYFGERALVADDKRTATCTAIGNDCRVLTLDREDFVALLGSVEDLVQHGTNEEVEIVEQEDRVALDVT